MNTITCKMEQICRVCLNTGPEMFFIFYDSSAHCGSQLSDMFRHITGIAISPGDGLPELMCCTCIERLENAFSFRDACLKSDSYLKMATITESKNNLHKEHSLNDDSIYIDVTEESNDSAINIDSTKEKTMNCMNIKICHICNKSYNRATFLGRHLRNHHLDNTLHNKKFLCSECGTGFTARSSLLSHTLAHKNIKKYTCKFCGVKFRSTYSLKIHERRHTNEKPYVCATCGLQFRASGILLVHMRKHTGELPYTCTVEGCSKAYAQSSELKMHIRSKHTGERQFQCDSCDKNFITRQHLKQHYQRNHEAKPTERNFACPICVNKYYTKSAVTKHLKQVHKLSRKDYLEDVGEEN